MRLPVWILMVALTATGCDRITNSPHALGAEKTNTLFNGFQERSPKYFDPTASYSVDETPFLYSIFEPPYRFHYLKRPYEVMPRSAEAVVASALLRQGRPRASRRCAWPRDRRVGLRHQDKKGDQVRAASGLRAKMRAASTSITR